jgi:hypothetical protein
MRNVSIELVLQDFNVVLSFKVLRLPAPTQYATIAT